MWTDNFAKACARLVLDAAPSPAMSSQPLDVDAGVAALTDMGFDAVTATCMHHTSHVCVETRCCHQAAAAEALRATGGDQALALEKLLGS